MISLLGISILIGLAQAQQTAPTLRGSASNTISAASVQLNNGNDAPYLLERQGQRHLAVGGMKAQSCNDSYSSCVGWSDLFGTDVRHSSLVVIPCGSCVVMDHAEATLTLDGGLDIQGKLEFPNGYSGLTLRSTMIVVQGELEMVSTGEVRATPAVKFVMIGNTNQFYEPIGENSGYCGAQPCLAGKKAITVAGGRVDLQGLPHDAKTWVKLYDVTDSGQSTSGIVVPEDGVLRSWEVGAEILITSYSQKGDNQQVRRITKYDTDYRVDGYIRLFLDRPITRGDDDTAYHGGHFWIFETRAHQQNIDGVEIVNFGQAGTLGRYPLHAHLCGDLTDSVISRNTIRESNQRCVVVHASDNLLIKDNVAYDTGGHCFMLEDGMETGNQFMGNLGAKTRPPGRVIPDLGSNGEESDEQAATFWIPALGNTWVGNVAAGSTDNGWWFEPMMRGSLVGNYPDWKPEQINIERFEGNVAHSNGIGMKTYPKKGLRPDASKPNRIVNFKAYRNQYKGLFAFFAHNLDIEGGLFADSSVNLDIDNCLNVNVYDATIIGESEIYSSQIAAQRMRTPCLSNMAVGLQLNTDRGITGVTVHSASFSDFSASRCGSAYAARIDNDVMSTSDIPEVGGGNGGDPSGDHSLGDLDDGLYINCGGGENVGLIAWEADMLFDNGESVQMNPNRPTNFNQFRQQDGRSLDYTIPVNDGMYEVTLYWVEFEHRRTNRRSFDVFLNDQRVLEGFDVIREAGRRFRIVKRRFIVAVDNDEELRISLIGTVDKAFLTLLSVRPHRG